MIGTIRFVVEDDQYRFRGSISGEDGNRYSFTSLNWVNRSLALSDLHEGMKVEFDLDEPNRNGRIFPKNVRFPGEVFEPAAPAGFVGERHSYGRFNNFVCVKTDAIILALEKLVDGFADSEYMDPANLYKKIAVTFNALQDEDFRFSGSGSEATVDFPLDFTSRDGHKIYLHCTPYRGDRYTWHTERVVVDGEVVGQSVFSIVNANWYDLESSIKEVIPDNRDSAQAILRQIEKRCFDNPDAFIYLKKGVVCQAAEADELYVPTGFCEKGGKEIYLLCSQRNGPRGFGWYFNSVTYENAPITLFDKRVWLEQWGGALSTETFEKLASQTLPEQWSFGNRGDFGILRNFLRYTFSHQYIKNEIGYSADKRYAAFNTGLPDRNTYKYLYAVYERAEAASDPNLHPLFYRQPYVFREFVLSGRGGMGKILSGSIRPLPNPPQYFAARSSTVWELAFNENNLITVPEYDDAHILIQRCERIPLEFYRYPATKAPRLEEILNSDQPLAEKYKDIREFFKPIMDNAPNQEVSLAYQTLVDSLDSVISTAVRKLSWNWRAVVPCYNPERDETCFLLPVSFCDSVKPDRAMIATANKVDDDLIYIIHTVIPLDWAYLDARLVCRPESEWLAANCIDEEES